MALNSDLPHTFLQNKRMNKRMKKNILVWKKVKMFKRSNKKQQREKENNDLFW
mgnify:CR=1 FL=1